MKTLILPGYSPHNKDWAEKVKKNLEPKIPVSIVYWKHWETGKPKPFWRLNEAERILSNNPKKVNILAKSIGTSVTMTILRLKPKIVNKIVLCGVPLNDLQEEGKEYYRELTNVPQKKVICFQNENDNHGTYKEVEAFIHSINSGIKIIPKPRSDHEYPYYDDFIEFLM